MKKVLLILLLFGKIKSKNGNRDVGRVLGLAYGFVDSISKMIPFDPSRPQSLKECIASEVRLQKLINEEPQELKNLLKLSLKLEGLNRMLLLMQLVLLYADKKLTEVVPLYKDALQIYYYRLLNSICIQQKMLD
jgi:DNA polymerase-3 subunit alpha